MFSMITCIIKRFSGEPRRTHPHYPCDILLEAIYTGMVMISCLMSFSLWHRIMLNVFGALHRDRVYLYPPRAISEWQKSTGIIMLDEESGLHHFSPPLSIGRSTCFQ